MSETRTDEYVYNIRGELISAAKNAEDSKIIEYQYQYDDIGNRISSYDIGTNRTYTANNLNQYIQISNLCDFASLCEEFIPQFDDDGNQTLIQTATGIWQVTYNGENRPTLWQCVTPNSLTPNSSTPSLLSMSYDRMGRRVTKNDQRFIYNGYLCIGKIEDSTSIHYSLSPIHCFVWDPTEPVATRPLAWLVLRSLGEGGYYTHDGNKNVSEVIAENGGVAAQYEYTPFGAVAVLRGASSAANPWRFSCEYAEDDTATVYYNYRHYEPMSGRWLSRDYVDEIALYLYCGNFTAGSFDLLGNKSYSYEINLTQTPAGFSSYARVSVVESDCPKETEIEILLGIEWQPPQLRAANRVLSLFRVHFEAEFRGLLGGKVRVSECAGKSTAKVCGRIEAFGRVEYRGWKVHEM